MHPLLADAILTAMVMLSFYLLLRASNILCNEDLHASEEDDDAPES